MGSGDEAFSFPAELDALLGPPADEGGARVWRLDREHPGLPVEVRLAAGEARVDLAGYARSFDVAALDATDDEAREDAEEVARSVLDLVGGASFGDVSIALTRAGGRTFRRTLLLRRRRTSAAEDTEWSVVDSQRGLAWPPWARRTRVTLKNEGPRPASHPFAPREPPVPWAPWAGVAGYLGADPEQLPITAALPLDGELDLHNFHPKEVKPVVLEYIEQCRTRGITELRIVHGKGKGHLRRTVHAILERHPHVRRFELGGHGGGGWGATVVELEP